MKARLEHANICVKNIEVMTKYLQTAFPHFKVRGGGTSPKKVEWLHIGTDETYLALQLATEDADCTWVPYGGKPGVNHLAYEVDDVDAIRDRLLSAGYQESTVPNIHPHRKRVYFLDPEGNDWEFIQYFTENPKERHDYETPDA